MASTNTTTASGLLNEDPAMTQYFTGENLTGKDISAKKATKWGLGTAMNLMGKYPLPDYPSFTPSQTLAPTTSDYINYTPNQPMASITSPNYQYNATAPTYQSGQYAYANSARSAAPNVASPGTAPAGTWGTVANPTYAAAQTAPTWQGTALNKYNVADPYNQNTVGMIGGGYNTYDPSANATVTAPYQKATNLNTTASVNAYGGAAPEYQKLANAADMGQYQKLGGATPDYQTYGGNKPTYQGLMGQDYDALQAALAAPGETAAKRAYEQAMQDIQAQMGGRGLYGSSIMQQQALTKAQQPYMDTLSTNAANAVAQRYGLQSSDLANQNTFNTDIYKQLMAENLAKNTQGMNVWQGLMGENQSAQGQKLNVLNALMAENAAANEQGYNTWNTRVAENLTAGQANQDFQSQLNNLLANENQAANTQNYNVASQNADKQFAEWQARLAENEAANAQGLDVAKTNQATQLAGAGLNLNAAQGNQQANTALNQLLAQLGIAQNTQASNNWATQLDYNQNQNALQNDVFKALLGQEQARNTQGLNAYTAQTGAQQNAEGLLADLYKTGLSDVQQQDTQNMNWQNFLANQNQAQNAYGMDAAKLQSTIDAQRNADTLGSSQLMATQNQNLYNAGLTDADRTQAYNLQKQQYEASQAAALRDWYNQQQLEKMQYELASNASSQANTESLINQALAIAGKGAPLATANAQLKALQDANSTNNISGLLQGLIAAGGTAGAAYLGK